MNIIYPKEFFIIEDFALQEKGYLKSQVRSVS